MNLEISKEAFVKGTICFLFRGWGELGGRRSRDICSKEDSEWMLRTSPGKILYGETVKAQSVNVLTRSLEKPFSKTTLAVGSALTQMIWHENVVLSSLASCS